MSKTIPSGLSTHLSGEVYTLATCWKVTRTDSTVFGFTDHDQDLNVSGVTYEASTGFTRTAIANSSNMAVDNLDVDGVVDSNQITREDLIKGLFDHATIEIFMVDYTDAQPITDTIKLRKGTLGEVQIMDNQFHAEIRGLTQALQQTIIEVYSPTCRAQLGDARCGVTLATYTVTGTVTGVTDNANFTDSGRSEADDLFNYGLLTWTSGNNNGATMEVKDYTQSGGTFELFANMPFDVQVGDTYSVYQGCDKRVSTCKTKFSNIVNFRGEPFIPGQDQVTKFGGQ